MYISRHLPASDLYLSAMPVTTNNIGLSVRLHRVAGRNLDCVDLRRPLFTATAITELDTALHSLHFHFQFGSFCLTTIRHAIATYTETRVISCKLGAFHLDALDAVPRAHSEPTQMDMAQPFTDARAQYLYAVCFGARALGRAQCACHNHKIDARNQHCHRRQL